jgi:M6 family metalloprotease-like protein
VAGQFIAAALPADERRRDLSGAGNPITPALMWTGKAKTRCLVKWFTVILLVMLSIFFPGEGLGPSNRAAAAPPPAARPDLHRRGSQPFLTILCKFHDTPFEPKPRAEVESIFSQTGLDDYWREVSYGAINLEGSHVVGWYALPYAGSDYMVSSAAGVDLQRLARDCAAAADPDVVFGNYAGIDFVFSNNLTGRPWGGNVELTLDASSRHIGATWLWPETLVSQGMLLHEMGHALGLAHSAAGGGQEYANIWDVMSSHGSCSPDAACGPGAQHMIAYDKDLLGWIPPARKFVAPPDGVSTIVLEQLAQPGSGNYLMAVIPIAGSSTHFYTVEARRRAGFDSSLPGDAVVIHEIDTNRELPARLVNHAGDGDVRVSASMWTPGMTFVDAPHNLAVFVDGATPTGFAVKIYTGSRPWPRSPAEHTVVPAGEVSLRWEAVPGARGYELSAHCGGPTAAAWHLPPQAVPDTATNIRLPRGECEWQVRALPVGEWAPPFHLRVAAPEGQWLPGELIRAPGPETPASLAVSAVASGVISVGWADPGTKSAPAAVHVARRAGSTWEYVGLFGDEEDPRVGSNPRLSFSPDGRVCAAWKPSPPPAIGAHSSAIGGDADVWYACWSTGTPGAEAAPDRDAGQAAEDNNPQPAVRVNQGGRYAFPFLPAVATDAAGGVYAVWEEFGPDAKADIYSAQRAADGSWVGEALVTGSAERAGRWSPALAVDPYGNATAVWRDGRNDALDIYAAYRPEGGDWQQEVRLTGPAAEEHHSPAVAVDALGDAYAAWRSYSASTGNGVIGSIAFSMRPAGGEWQPPVTVAWDIGGREVSAPAIAATSDGGVYLVWEEESAGFYGLYSAYRTPDGAWEPMTAIAESAGNSAAASPAIVVDAAGRAYLAWIRHQDDQAALWFAMTR